jgi:hypothetical protein
VRAFWSSSSSKFHSTVTQARQLHLAGTPHLHPLASVVLEIIRSRAQTEI